jgi:hypothetical protein
MVAGLLVISVAVSVTATGRYLWASEPRVSVQLRYEAESTDETLYYASVVSGADKHHWYEIPAGKRRTVTLRRGNTDDAGITLFYQCTSADETRVWEGPDIPVGFHYEAGIVVSGNCGILVVDDVLVRNRMARD